MRLVLNLAEKAESDAATQLQQQRLQLQSQSDQLTQIANYNQEYSTQINQLGSINVEQMIGQRNFMSQLSQMIQTQSETVDILRQQTERAQQQWMVQYQRKQKLGELIEKLEREESQLEQQRLQKELDEISRTMIGGGSALH
ncbi:hypothetical protein GCM10025791_13010 [Halioxenophilus aromaticivorans]|uniref:Flagellar FliJ protein n=1 Tax=Halioxenophilus aromaticivorans TaxID=1306992 RepID=A0AAV3U0C4_9ALTE